MSEARKKYGCTKGAGRGKHGWYKGYWCDSSWELAYVIYNLEHDIKFTRNTQGFEYEFEGKKHKYYPDFILEDGTYVEIKGQKGIQWEEKKKSFSLPLILIDKLQISKYIKYSEEKYGYDFIKLYDGNPYKNNKVKKNACLMCNKPTDRTYCSVSCSVKHRHLKKKAH
jgi:hypothetical protein